VFAKCCAPALPAAIAFGEYFNRGLQGAELPSSLQSLAFWRLQAELERRCTLAILQFDTMASGLQPLAFYQSSRVLRRRAARYQTPLGSLQPSTPSECFDQCLQGVALMSSLTLAKVFLLSEFWRMF
jgi:hypothetical protein